MLNYSGISKRFFLLFTELSRKEMATIFGVGASAISDWENNKSKIPWKRLEYAVETKGVSWDWLLLGKEEGIAKGGDVNGMMSIQVDDKAGRRMCEFIAEIKKDPDWRSRCERLGLSVAKLEYCDMSIRPDIDLLIAVGRLGGDVCWILTGERGIPAGKTPVAAEQALVNEILNQLLLAQEELASLSRQYFAAKSAGRDFAGADMTDRVQRFQDVLSRLKSVYQNQSHENQDA